MTTKTIHFTPGRVYCINLADDAEDAAPLLVAYHGPEQPWEDICSGEYTSLDADAIEDAFEVPPDIVAAIARSSCAPPRPAQTPESRADRDDAPEAWEHDVYWDD